jgi:hypothetical protein
MTDLAVPDATVFELDQRRAKAYSESGYWPDAKSQAQALVTIEAGRSLNLPPIMAMSEIHVIEGKPTLGAGALAALVKSSGRYDYRIVHHDRERCAIRFFDRGEPLEPLSEFTIKDAQDAGLASGPSWKKYPRNMLFARAISNGVAWHCPDVTSGRLYTPEEFEALEEPSVELEAGVPFSDNDEPDREQLTVDLLNLADTLGLHDETAAMAKSHRERNTEQAHVEWLRRQIAKAEDKLLALQDTTA